MCRSEALGAVSGYQYKELLLIMRAARELTGRPSSRKGERRVEVEEILASCIAKAHAHQNLSATKVNQQTSPPKPAAEVPPSAGALPSAGYSPPSDSWMAKAWISSLDEAASCIADALVQPLANAPSAPHCELRFLRALGGSCANDDALGKEVVAALLHNDHTLDTLAAVVWTGIKELSGTRTVREMREQQHKFVQDEEARELSFADLSIFFGGLEALVGPPNANVLFALTEEHWHAADSHKRFTTSNYGVVTTSAIEHAFVTDGDAGLQKFALAIDGMKLSSFPREAHVNAHSREPRPLADFAAKLADVNARLAKMTQPAMETPELIAARLYTGPLYQKYNLVLRGSPSLRGAPPALTAALQSLCEGNRYQTTLHCINSAIVKLSKLTRATTVFRGVRGGVLPASFTNENDFGVRGGVECGFMSTTTDRHVAIEYADGRQGAGATEAAGFLFEIQQGMVDRGAELGWLSQYPHEAEILFAPLTSMELHSVRVDGGVLVYEVRLAVNLAAKTIEQVVAKRKGLLGEMRDAMAMEVRAELHTTGFEEVSVNQLVALVESNVLHRLPADYNDDAVFHDAVQRALAAKRDVLSHPTRLLAFSPTQRSAHAEPITRLLAHADAETRLAALGAFGQLGDAALREQLPAVLRLLGAEEDVPSITVGVAGGKPPPLSPLPVPIKRVTSRHLNLLKRQVREQEQREIEQGVLETAFGAVDVLEGPTLAPCVGLLLALLERSPALLEAEPAERMRQHVLAAVRKVAAIGDCVPSAPADVDATTAAAADAPPSGCNATAPPHALAEHALEILEALERASVRAVDALVDVLSLVPPVALHPLCARLVRLLRHTDGNVKAASLASLRRIKDAGLQVAARDRWPLLLRLHTMSKRSDLCGVAVAALRQLGAPAKGLATLGYRAEDLVRAGYSDDVHDLGYSASELVHAGFSVESLRGAGFGALELKKAGVEANALHEGGFSLVDLRACGFDASTLKAAGCGASELLQAGFALNALKQAGFGVTALRAAGCNASDLRLHCNFDASELRAGGFVLGELVAARFNTQELKWAGFTLKELVDDAKFSIVFLRRAFDEKEMLEFGFTMDEVLGR